MHRNLFNITIITRPESEASERFPAGLKVVSAEYNLDALKQALVGQDAVVSVVGVPATLSQMIMIDAAEAVGVKRFIVSQFGHFWDKQHLPEMQPPRELKDKVLKYVEAKAAANPSFTWSAVATGVFFDWVSETILHNIYIFSTIPGTLHRQRAKLSKYVPLEPPGGTVQTPVIYALSKWV
jgi:hypothetical protein